MKKILILCTGNSCRSIIAEALINHTCKNIKAYSAGVKASGKVHPLAKEILLKKGMWDEKYYSKEIGEILKNDFDLVVSVCENAKQNCPIFPKKTKNLHVGFDDPDGKGKEEFAKTYEDIKNILLPKVLEVLG